VAAESTELLAQIVDAKIGRETVRVLGCPVEQFIGPNCAADWVIFEKRRSGVFVFRDFGHDALLSGCTRKRAHARPESVDLARPMNEPERDEGLKLAIEAAGSINALAQDLGMTVQALWEWRRVPAHRIVQVEAVTKVPREKLRPDLYRR
jgi:hypothetical protein